MDVSIKIEDAKLQEAFKKAPETVVRELQRWVQQVAVVTQNEVKKQVAPKVDTSNLQNSIEIDERRLRAEVTPTAKHAPFVNFGRRPGRFPPFQQGSELERWASKKGMNPFLVARSIARKGIKEHPFMARGRLHARPKANRLADRTLERIVASI